MRLYCLLIFILTSFALHAQHANSWLFGDGAGLHFSNGSPSGLSGSSMITYEGCASWSDASGNLMFYTNGDTVWNKNHNIMTNGTNLLGDFSSTQSSVFIPLPGNQDLFYLFTIDHIAGPNDGLRYSVIDMTLSGGLGAVTSTKNILISLDTYERFTVAPHSNGVDFWIIYYHLTSGTLRANLFNSSGVNTIPVISSQVYAGTNSLNVIGQMKASPAGCKVAMTGYNNSVILFDFNNSTGHFSNSISLQSQYFSAPYGIEFSGDGTLLYVANRLPPSKIFQLDLTAANTSAIINSAFPLDTTAFPSGLIASLQLAQDGKIYAARYGSDSIDVINFPNLSGAACFWQRKAIPLPAGTFSKLGLPHFIPSLFINQSACFNYIQNCDSVKFNPCSPNASLSWNFGDTASGTANFSTLSNPTHYYATPGTYIVTSIATFLCASDTFVDTIVVYPVIPASFSSIHDSCLPQLYFSHPGGIFSSFAWDFGDGNTSTDSFPANLYDSAGVYTVSLIANSFGICSDTITDTIQVYDEPEAAFQYLADPCFPKVDFTNNTIHGGSYYWNFGDGTTDTTTSLQHTFPAEGTYLVTLISNYGSTCADTVTDSIQVYEWAVPYFNVSTDSCIPLITTNNLSHPAAFSYLWSYGDGNISNVFEENYSFQSPGFYEIKLVVNQGYVCADSMSVTIQVFDAPEPSFSISTACSDSLYAINISDSLADFLWDFGDGITSADFQPNHWYGSPGTYLVSLTLTDSNQCSSTEVDTVVIKWTPDASFIADKVPCFGPVNFNNTSQQANSYLWNFGDGNTSLSLNPTHTYGDTGNYLVTLVAYSDPGLSGCTDTAYYNLLLGLPVLSFYADDPDGCLPHCTYFINNSTAAADDPFVSFLWNFGDGGTLQTFNPNYCYSKEGIYDVTLEVLTSLGCKYSLTKPSLINASGYPKASFFTDDNEFTVSSPGYWFNNTSQGAVQYQWLVNNQNQSQTFDHFQTFGDTGNYIISLVAINEAGCKDITVQEIRVNHNPAIWIPRAFTPDNDNLNQLFKAYGEGIETFSMKIFNRWGQLIYLTTDIHSGWDGTWKGADSPIDQYVYKITVTFQGYDKEEIYTGNFFLIR